MRKQLIILFLLANSISLLAGTITGKVIDFGTKKPIDFANVSVMQGENLVTGTITDEKGDFTIEIKDGQYTLVVSFMGYSEQRKAIEVAGKLNVGRISLREDTQMLKDVEVV